MAGKEIAGEGALSLQRAVRIAGADAVVGNLWRPHNIVTRMLMRKFYQELWNKDKPKPWNALRQAQLWLTNGHATDASAKPWYWAGWTISVADLSILKTISVPETAPR